MCVCEHIDAKVKKTTEYIFFKIAENRCHNRIYMYKEKGYKEGRHYPKAVYKHEVVAISAIAKALGAGSVMR